MARTSISDRTKSVVPAPPMKGASPMPNPVEPSIDEQVDAAVAWLKRHATTATLEGMARYAIPSDHAFGVSMANIQQLAKRLGRNQALAQALWETGWYEARTLAAYVGEPDRLTSAQMDRWCRDFDNWALCDTVCFSLWDKSPHAWEQVEAWAGHRDEFVKRAAFALLASLASHDKVANDEQFIQGLSLIERESADARNFVKKAANWALRVIGLKRSSTSRAAARKLAEKLSASEDATARWNGKDALRAFTTADAKATAKKAAPASKTARPAKKATARKAAPTSKTARPAKQVTGRTAKARTPPRPKAGTRN